MVFRYSILIVALLTALGVGAGKYDADDSNLLLSASFNKSLDADFSAGDSTAYTTQFIKQLPLTGTLKMLPQQWFCYDSDKNISFKEGTLIIRVKPDFSPGKGTLDKHLRWPFIFAIRNRMGQRLECKFDDKKSYVRIYCSNGSRQTSNIKVPLKNWEKGQWRIVTVAWKYPDKLFLGIQGEGKQLLSSSKLKLPFAPEKCLYNIYLGSNAQALPRQQYGLLGTLPGELDDLRIYNKYMPKLFTRIPQTRLRSKSAPYPRSVNASPQWISRNRSRINIFLGKTRKQWKNNPVQLKIDLREYLANSDISTVRKMVKSMRLVQFDPRSGKPISGTGKTGTDAEYFRSFRMNDDFFGDKKGTLNFVHRGKLPAAYSIYFDKDAPYEKAVPANYPFAGTGLPILSGTKHTPGNFAGALRGNFDLFDADGDGDLDLWFVSGSQTDSGRDLHGGHYYHENLKDKYGYNLFAPGVLIVKGQNEFGLFRQTATPHIIDINNDRKLDLVIASEHYLGWADFDMEQGRPVIKKWHPLKFNGKPPKLISTSVFHDFNRDGLLDIFCDAKIHYNIGTKNSPLFDSKGISPFNSSIKTGVSKGGFRDTHGNTKIFGPDGENIRPLTWDIVDVNGDGILDLVCGGWKSLLYYFPGAADGKFGSAKRLCSYDGYEISSFGVFPFPLFRDFDNDGDLDLMLSNEGGELLFCQNIADASEVGLKLMLPVSTMEQRSRLNAGALAIPVVTDWNADGRNDIIAGAADGYIYLFENINNNTTPVFKNAQPLTAGGYPIVLRAGPDGSVQGDQESDWGYLNPEVADFDQDGLKDLIVSGVRGDHWFFKNIGSAKNPILDAGRLIEVEWQGKTPYPQNLRYKPKGKELITVHRCRPAVIDWDGDGLVDYITTDHKDKLAFYKRFRKQDGSLGLMPGKNIFAIDAPYFRSLIWNHYTMGGYKKLRSGQEGRSVIQLVDWDKDGKLDLIMDNINGRFLKNVSDDKLRPRFRDKGDLSKLHLANHNAGPYAVDFDQDGELDLILGTECGYIYYFSRPFIEKDTPPISTTGIQNKKQ
jgi:hypothetical protein